MRYNKETFSIQQKREMRNFYILNVNFIISITHVGSIILEHGSEGPGYELKENTGDNEKSGKHFNYN